MRLGQLIDALSEQPSMLPVRFSTGNYPDAFASWRGSYEMEALLS